MGKIYKVAVVGAGTAGLLTARELQREGHHITVFEKAGKVGGIWLYNPRVESDPLGLDPNREIVHSSLYKSLRANLPRQAMSFLDYPFVKKEGGDPRTFPGHEEVLRFLDDFARDFGLMKLIQFGHEVIRVELVDELTHEWVVESRIRKTESTWESKEESFKAVVICNGNESEPNVADFPGIDTWPGLQMHSHNYRTPEAFENKIVILIGNGPSAVDILKEISPLAKQVHLAVRTPSFQMIRVENYANAWQHSMIECALKDGKVVFQDGSIVDADVIIHCTGYKYHYPFLKSNGIVTVDDNRVGPMYKHVFPPSLAPWLSFVGLNNRAVVFRVMELQARWVAKVLSGTVELPSEEAMAVSVEEHYSEMEKAGVPKRHTHSLMMEEVEYVTWLATQLNIKPLKMWKEITVFSFVEGILHYGENFRDIWDIDKWIQKIDSSD
ncbi:repetitive proline-rich cell wall protein 1-like [Hibiscus syriacus]|uniref:Flavin-containing monooxygenase n=1 Tax=Hibiscus syriacus TaxID=106335 RepID=A0A6A2ZPQ4_HIBSY|nr:flavin-containing monooxygenase FMO GS-OX5-like [Hibiscus syriacus]KAE8693783.1 repetitive proline-rich cell wall protein 1-like [Hibiscus syriacus]